MNGTPRTRVFALTVALVLFAGGIGLAASLAHVGSTSGETRSASVGPAVLADAASGPLGASLTVSPSQVQSGQSIQIQTTATGGVQPYTFSYSGLPGGCSNQNQPSLTCNPTSTGTFTVQASVSDSNGSHTQSNSVSVDVTSSSNNGNGNGKGGGNNSSNPISSLFSGFSGLLPLLLIFGVVGFVTWILLLVGVWIIAITLVRRLPKRGTIGAAEPTTPCAKCSAAIPVGSKFCSECGAATAPKGP
ncbi:MAG: hypothetical protein L3K01_01660 [Thermoplasmata archaeon]|nr:hypothetical protein [Thermoplasmata archaeon]MCI4332427.1 hypothetical protein [Thermoplasmata archaeon]